MLASLSNQIIKNYCWLNLLQLSLIKKKEKKAQSIDFHVFSATIRVLPDYLDEVKI